MTIDTFFQKKRDKKFYRFLKIWLFGNIEYSDIEIAKNLSSMITHSLIEMEFEGLNIYTDLDIALQSKLLNQFIEGVIDEPAIRAVYTQRYQEAL